MPRQVIVKAGFERAYRRLSDAERPVVDAALQHFQRYLETRQASVGLGLKHLGGRTYELRAGLALRIVYVLTETEVVLALLGTHDEVRRFLKRQ